LFPEQYLPTYTHYFIKLLYKKGILLRDYTQNIDGLERQAGIPDSRLVESHGTMSSCSCILCKRPYKTEWFKTQIISGVFPRCKCGGLVKPDIVFFGEPLPQKFNWMSTADMASCDLLIVIGTSLAVQPFAGMCKFKLP
jgi:NAD-dependent SIR2 family protein deacetylase